MTAHSSIFINMRVENSEIYYNWGDATACNADVKLNRTLHIEIIVVISFLCKIGSKPVVNYYAVLIVLEETAILELISRKEYYFQALTVLGDFF